MKHESPWRGRNRLAEASAGRELETTPLSTLDSELSTARLRPRAPSVAAEPRCDSLRSIHAPEPGLSGRGTLTAGGVGP